MKLYKAIHSIIELYGKEVIRKEVLVNFLADYHAFEIKPTKHVMKTFLQLGYGEKIFMLDEKDAPDKLLKVKNYVTEMVFTHGFQEIHVNYLIDSFCYALGWIELPPETITPEAVTEASSYRTITINGISFRMILIKGDSYDIGATPEQGIYAAYDEKPSIRVSVNDYYIGETVVSQELWEYVMKNNPSHFKGAKLPVERVSWEECLEFINKLNSITGCKFRMLTEAEWEFAARGGTKTKHYKYSGCDDSNKNDYVWHKENSHTQSHDIKSGLPNELGIYCMSGNIGEWCQDWYFNSYANNGISNNPTGPTSGTTKVYRGGSWGDKAMNCRVSKRFNMNTNYRNKLVGLRLAATNL